MRHLIYGLVFLVAGLSWIPRAEAQESESDLVLMNEPITFTDVADAFDEHDPFDINLSVGFRRMRDAGLIRREVSTAADLTGWVDIADWEHVRNILDVGAEIGIFHDVSLFVDLPVVLSDTRMLTIPDGTDAGTIAGHLSPE
ncbi:MAG: hypothetical protein OEY14_16115, partial [Myxococcales bacterium]|nr:hypothetical protein [Myxococcales bacterium]